MPISQPTQPVVHPVQSGQPFAIISGEEPRHIPEVRGGHKALEQMLAQNGVKYEASDANFANGKAHSPVVIAYGLPRDQAMEYGRKMGQDSIIFSNAGQHEFLYTNGPNAGKYHPSAPQSMQVFPSMPDEGLATRIPGLGHVRFNFDHGKLLDVPHKGSAMSEDTKKSEVSVAEFKQKLAEVLRGKIEVLSKSMEGYASREVATNSDASIGDFKKSGSALSLQSSEPCIICGFDGACPCVLQDLSKSEKLSKSHTMAISAAMKRVYDSYMHNVASKQHPNDPAAAHQLALAAAKDWASRAKDPKSVYRMAMGHSGEGQEQANAVAHAPRVGEMPDSMGPNQNLPRPASPIVKNNPLDRQAVKPPVPSEQDKSAAIEAHFFGGGGVHNQPGLGARQTPHAARLPGVGGTPYRKNEMCKGCSKSMENCKCSDMDKNQGPGFSHTSQTQRKKQMAAEGRQVGKLGEDAKARWNASNQELSRRKRGQDPATGKPLSQSEWKAELERSEDWIDLKNANARPTSTDDAKKGGPRVKNTGAETPEPAQATKEVKGNLDEGSGGDVTKGKGLKKEAMPMSNDPASPAVAPLAQSQKAPGMGAPPKPPMAVPPTQGQHVSKPTKPKKAGLPMGKAAIPMGTRTSAGAADAAAHAARQGQVGAKAGGVAAPVAPKAVPKPPSAFDAEAFKPTGNVSSGLELDTPKVGPQPGKFGAGKLPAVKKPGQP